MGDWKATRNSVDCVCLGDRREVSEMSQVSSKMGNNINHSREIKIHWPINFIYRNLYPKGIIMGGGRTKLIFKVTRILVTMFMRGEKEEGLVWVFGYSANLFKKFMFSRFSSVILYCVYNNSWGISERRTLIWGKDCFRV